MTPEAFEQNIQETLKGLDEYALPGIDTQKRAEKAAACIRALLAQLPEGMKNCTIEFVECEKGHSRLTAANWIDIGCMKCELDRLTAELQNMTAKAFAAVWLLPEDVEVRDLLRIRGEAEQVFLGRDKQTIAKLQDELVHAREHIRQLQRLPRPGVNTVYALELDGERNEIRRPLPLMNIRRGYNGELEIEVKLP